MKIWITYGSANGLWSSGIQNCRIWFRKPTYYYSVQDHGTEFSPWELADKQKGLLNEGWKANTCDGKEGGSISFGRVFGYGDNEDANLSKMANYLWECIEKHFGEDSSKPNSHDMFELWSKLENEGLVKSQDFLLEWDLEIKLNNK